MKRPSRFLFFFVLLLAGGFTQANDAVCENALQRLEPHARPAPRRWQKIDEFLRKSVEGQSHPFAGSERDANAAGRVHLEMANQLPVYRQVLKMTEQNFVPLSDFLKVKRQFDRYVSAAVKNPPAPLLAFALLEANRMLAQIEARVDFPAVVEAEVAKEEAETAEETQAQPKLPKQKARFPKNENDQYKPENKDISGGGGSQEVIHIVETSVNPPARLLRGNVYDYVGLDRWSKVATSRPVDTEIKNTQEFMRIRPLGETQLRIFYNYDNYTPQVGTYKGYSVVEVLPGEYQLLLQKPIEEVLLPLVRRSPGEFRNGTNINSYTTKLNIPLASWPANIQNFVRTHQGQSGLTIAQALAKFLSSRDGDFLYYSTGDKIDKNRFAQLKARLGELKGQMPEPIAFAHLGAFNCDGAAWIATILLREYFDTPTRPATGVTVAGFKKVKGRPVYVTRSTDPLHAWIEVFDGQYWRPFDPTPKTNNPQMSPQDKDDSEKLETIDEPEDSTPQGESSAEADGSDEGQKDSPDGEEAQADSTDNSSDQQGDLIEKGLAEKLTEGQSDGKSNGQNLETSISFLRRYEQFVLESYFAEGQRDKWLTRLDNLRQILIRKEARNVIARVRQRILELSRAGRGLCDDSLIICLRNAQFLLSKGDARGSYNILRSLLTQLDDLTRLRTLNANELEFHRQLQNVLKTYRRYNHKNAESFDLVEHFLNSLPGSMSQNLLLQRYGITKLSPDSVEVTNLAQDLLRGRLKNFQRLAAAREYIDFALRGMFLPEAREVLNHDRSLDPRARQDLVIARSALEITRMLLQPRPGEHLLAPLIQGRQFAIGPRASTLTEDPKTPIERKLSVFFYDISSSMGEGQKAYYQAAVLAAFVEMKLLEVDPLGRPSHEVILVPFDHKVHDPIVIKTPADALRVITHLINNPTAVEGSTDIQLAILEFYRLVGEALRDKAKNSPFQQFQHANLILASDGGSTLDLQALAQARAQIDPNLNINMSFVAIGETNKDIAELVRSTSLSTSKPNYIELMGSMMGQLETSFKKVKTDQNAFVTTESTYLIQRDVSQDLGDLQRKAVEVRHGVSSSDLQKLLTAIRDGGTDDDIARLNKEAEAKFTLEMITALLKADFDPAEKRVLAYDLVTSHVRDQNRQLSQMTVTEEILLKKFLKWALQ